jgi:predicted RNase H-like HicB family nuclease
VPAHAASPDPSSVSLSVRLNCYLRRDGRKWVAVCPALDVASQGATEAEAQAALKEAIDLWFESCLERETLEAALREVGFRVRSRGEEIPSRADRVTVRRSPRSKVTDLSATAPVAARRRQFEIRSEVPAFIAARLLENENSAAL